MSVKGFAVSEVHTIATTAMSNAWHGRSSAMVDFQLWYVCLKLMARSYCVFFRVHTLARIRVLSPSHFYVTQEIRRSSTRSFRVSDRVERRSDLWIPHFGRFLVLCARDVWDPQSSRLNRVYVGSHHSNVPKQQDGVTGGTSRVVVSVGLVVRPLSTPFFGVCVPMDPADHTRLTRSECLDPAQHK